MIDLGTGMWAVIGVLSALHRRDVSGAGGIVDAAMLDTAVAWNNLGVALLEAGDEIPRRLGLQGGLLAPNGAYQTADGLLMMTVGTDPQFSRLCDVMQKSEVASDPRFADNAARVRNHGELKALMDDALGQNTRAYWWKKLCAADVPCAPIQSIEEMIEHPQILANDVVQRSPDDGFRLVGLPLKFDGERPAFRNMAPDLGAQTEAVFGRFSDQGGD